MTDDVATADDVDLRCYPARDELFRLDVQRAIASSRGSINAGQRLIDAVRADLASRYPSIVVRERDALAAPDEDGAERWYVFRDGRIA